MKDGDTCPNCKKMYLSTYWGPEVCQCDGEEAERELTATEAACRRIVTCLAIKKSTHHTCFGCCWYLLCSRIILR